MIQETFIGTGGKKLAYRIWETTAKKKKGIVVIVHGYTEHSGRYEQFALFLNEKGFDVYAHDHVGHGLSEGIRAHVDTFTTYVEDVRTFMDIVREKGGILPVFMFGQSMGGIITLLYTARYGSHLAGSIVSAPALIVALKVPKILRTLSKVLAILFPKMKLNKGIGDLLSRDPSVIEQYKKDPLVYTEKNRARLGYILLNLEEWVPSELPNISVPLLVLQGTEDKIVDPKSARIIYERAGSSDKTLHWFNALYHELLHEPEKREVMKFIWEWMKR